MKYIAISLILFAASAHAWQSTSDSSYLSNNDIMYGGMGLEPYKAYQGVRRTERNLFGGEDYYGTQGYMGRTIPNQFGGRDYYPAQTIGW